MQDFRNTSWSKKFTVAFSGVMKGVAGQSSFYVHIPMAAAVLVVAMTLGLDVWRWAILLLCIAIVVVCELFNSSLERMAHAITSEYNENVGDALDIASGAVLVASIFAASIGVVVLLQPLLKFIAS